MDEELKGYITKTGTTTLGIVCRDGIVVAADKRASFGTSDNQGVSYIAGKDQQKISELTPEIIVTTAGVASDTRRIIKIARAELKLKELRSKSKPTVENAANLFSNISYQSIRQPSMIPSIAHFLMAGYDDNGIYLYDIMPDGFLEEVKDYTVSGSGRVNVNPILDSEYDKKISVEEGIKLAKKCITASMGRDPATGEGIDIYVVKKGEVKQVLAQTVVPEYKDRN
jgi:proteasome beta subunit